MPDQIDTESVESRAAAYREARRRQRRELEDLAPEVLALLDRRGRPDLVEVDVFTARHWRGPRREVTGAYAVCEFSHPRRGVPTRQQLYLLPDGRWLFGEANYPREPDDKQLNPLLGDVLDGLHALRRRHG